MKRIIILSGCIFIFAYGVVVGHYKAFPFSLIQSAKAFVTPEPKPRPFSTTEKFKRHVVLFDSLEKEYDVVFLGDSITNAGRWNELFPSVSVANRGVGGDTSEGILNRVDSVINHNPTRVFIMVGINDIARGKSVEDIFSNYKKIITRLTESGIEVVVQSTLLSSRKNWNESVNSLNDLLRSFTDSHDIRFIDINKHLAPNGTLDSANSYDGVHLYADMYLTWKQVISEFVEISD